MKENAGQGEQNCIEATETAKKKGVIDIAYKIHIIQEPACSERRNGSPSGILAKFDGNISLHGQ